jgi:hypothetical protein
MAMAYSATTVFPAEVCAATITLSSRSSTATDVSWKGSNTKSYCFARGPSYVGAWSAARSPFHPGGTATWCTHDLGFCGFVPGSSSVSASADRGDGARTVRTGEGSRLRLLARFAAASRTALDAALGALCAVGMSASSACGFAASASAAAALGRFFFFGGIVRLRASARRTESHRAAARSAPPTSSTQKAERPEGGGFQTDLIGSALHLLIEIFVGIFFRD